MKVPVFWVSWHDEILARGYADQGLLEAMLSRSTWTPPGAITFEHHEVRADGGRDGVETLLERRGPQLA